MKMWNGLEKEWRLSKDQRYFFLEKTCGVRGCCSPEDSQQGACYCRPVIPEAYPSRSSSDKLKIESKVSLPAAGDGWRAWRNARRNAARNCYVWSDWVWDIQRLTATVDDMSQTEAKCHERQHVLANSKVRHPKAKYYNGKQHFSGRGEVRQP